MGLHADLIALGTRWLRAEGCDVVLAEPWTPRGERPDVVGWRREDSTSILIEAKVSRRDLQKEWSFTDRDRKPFRYEAAAGVRRYYLAPRGVVPQELCEASGWGLLVPESRMTSGVWMSLGSREFSVNFQTELQILVRAASDPSYGKQRAFQIDLPFQTATNGASRR